MKGLNNKYLTLTCVALIAVAILLSTYLTVQRVKIEQEYNRVEILLNLTELLSLANANDSTSQNMAKEFKDRGVTGVLVKETSLGDLARTGQVEFFLGKELLQAPYYQQVSRDIPINDGNVIVTIINKTLTADIKKHLAYKMPSSKFYSGEISALVIPINIPNSDKEKELIYEKIKALGVGFNYPLLEDLADIGFTIVPQVRDWPEPTSQSLHFIAEEVAKLPNLRILLFNDQGVPGYPSQMQVLADEIKSLKGNIPVGMVEFFNQKGISKFSSFMDKEVVRIHSIAANDMTNYSPASAIERYDLAVKERNIRGLFVRLFKMDKPATALETNLAFIGDLAKNLEDQGYTLGEVNQFNSPVYSRLLLALIGLGVIAGGVLVIIKKGWLKLAPIMALAGGLVWAAILLRDPLLGRKLMALASVIIFPTLGFLIIIKEKGRSIAVSILSLIKLSAISLIGAVLMTGLLADKLFMLKLDQFIGVKAAHVLPLILIPVLIFILTEKPLATINKLLDQFISYRYVLLAGMALIALAVYVIRTGNDGTALVTGIEEQLRIQLKNILGVRPRTKEFLIGHPFTLVILYYGLNKKNWFLILPAIIGQVSLVNTYAHIHTPVIISLIRSFHGIWLGIIIGLIVIFSWQFYKKVSKKLM